jgi:hypothetical protein
VRGRADAWTSSVAVDGLNCFFDVLSGRAKTGGQRVTQTAPPAMNVAAGSMCSQTSRARSPPAARYRADRAEHAEHARADSSASHCAALPSTPCVGPVCGPRRRTGQRRPRRPAHAGMAS